MKEIFQCVQTRDRNEQILPRVIGYCSTKDIAEAIFTNRSAFGDAGEIKPLNVWESVLDVPEEVLRRAHTDLRVGAAVALGVRFKEMLEGLSEKERQQALLSVDAFLQNRVGFGSL